MLGAQLSSPSSRAEEGAAKLSHRARRYGRQKTVSLEDSNRPDSWKRTAPLNECLPRSPVHHTDSNSRGTGARRRSAAVATRAHFRRPAPSRWGPWWVETDPRRVATPVDSARSCSAAGCCASTANNRVEKDRRRVGEAGIRRRTCRFHRAREGDRRRSKSRSASNSVPPSFDSRRQLLFFPRRDVQTDDLAIFPGYPVPIRIDHRSIGPLLIVIVARRCSVPRPPFHSV